MFGKLDDLLFVPAVHPFASGSPMSDGVTVGRLRRAVRSCAPLLRTRRGDVMPSSRAREFKASSG